MMSPKPIDNKRPLSDLEVNVMAAYKVSTWQPKLSQPLSYVSHNLKATDTWVLVIAKHCRFVFMTTEERALK